MNNSIKSLILENDNESIPNYYYSSFSKIRHCILLPIVKYHTFRYNIFVVKTHLFNSEIFSFNPTRRMGVAIITILAL